MKKFWNWIHDDSGGRVLRLEGPIDEDDFWGDSVTPKMFRDELARSAQFKYCHWLYRLYGIYCKVRTEVQSYGNKSNELQNGRKRYP